MGDIIKFPKEKAANCKHTQALVNYGDCFRCEQCGVAVEHDSLELMEVVARVFGVGS